MPYSTTDPNQPPYYDDIINADDSRYLKILFRPGRAVQGRELTQIQSLLQKQIGHMGNHFFKNYTVISGGNVGLNRTTYYRINKSEDLSFDPTTFIGKKIKRVDANGSFYESGNTGSYIAGVVSHVEDATADDPFYVFYITYESNIRFNESDSFQWYEEPNMPSATMTITSSSDLHTHVLGSPDMPGTVPSWYGVTGSGAIAVVADGLFYVDGHFVRAHKQGLGINKTVLQSVVGADGGEGNLRNYDHLTSSVGFSIVDEVVEYSDDSALLDPSAGTSNFAAPGADRYRMSLNLTQREYVPIAGLTGISEAVNALDIVREENYFEILRVKEGQPQSVLSRTGYSSLADMLARRTYDESGNYIIGGFDIELLEHLKDSGGTQGAVDGAYTSDQGGDNDLFAVKFSKGKAYVKGHEYESYHDTILSIEKPRATKTITNDRIITNLGAYIIADARTADGGGGTFALGGVGGSPSESFETYEFVNLVGTTSPSFDGTGATGIIGSARLRNLQFMENDYKVFLSDIKMGRASNGLKWPEYLIESIHDGGTGAYPLDGSITAADNKVCDIHPVTGRFMGLGKTSGATGTYIFGRNNTSMVFTPDTNGYIKQWQDLAYFTRKSFTGTTDSSDDFKIELNSGTLGGSFTSGTVKFTSIDGTPGHKDYLVYSVDQQKFLTNGTGTNQVTYVINTDKTECTVTIKDKNAEDFILFTKLYVTATEGEGGSSNMGRRTKTLTKGLTASVTLSLNDGRYTGSIGYADVIKVNSIKNADGTEVKEKFMVDTGQRSTLYDHATIIGNGSIGATGTYTVDFDYFVPSGMGPFVVGSYDVPYEDIPDFMAFGSRNTVHLRDAIDFRPVRQPNLDTFDQSWTPHHTTTSEGAINAKYSHYLGRIDKLYMTPAGQFKQIKGLPAAERSIPASPTDGGMLLATMIIPPYVVNLSDIKYAKSDNTRYTMKDIGNVNRRIGRLEYETQLSALERTAESQLILDSSGNNRLKSGFLVDPMSSMAIVDNSDADVNIQILSGYAESPVRIHNLDMKVVGNTVAGLTKTSDDIYMLPYTSENVINQTVRSNRMSVNPYNLVSFVGEARIFPQSDTWVDTETAPVFTSELSLDASIDGWEHIASSVDPVIHGTNINAAGFIGDAADIRHSTPWLNVFGMLGVSGMRGDSGLWGEGGLQTFLNNANLSEEALQIIRTSVGRGWDDNAWVLTEEFVGTTNTSTSSTSLGNRVTNTSIIPYMRTKQIKIHFVGLTPNTRHYPFFNGTNVSEFCTDATPWGVDDPHTADEIEAKADAIIGGELFSDANGQLALIFDLPGGQFRTGQRIFKITNDDTNSFDQIGQPSFAEVEYQARGTLQTMEEVILNTSLRTNGLVRTEGQWANLGTVAHARYRDPLAQTFMVSSDAFPDGIWVDSIDLFFARKDSTLPVNVQIKPVVNGYPSSGAALPFASAQMLPSQVVIPGSTGHGPSETWDADNMDNNKTSFVFSTPVYLEPAEYCMVVTSNSDAYEVWYSDMGEYELNPDGTSSENRIMEQPYAGTFFKSQNASTWTAEQNQDMCFRLNRCKFTASSGSMQIQETVQDSDVANTYYSSAEAVNGDDGGNGYKIIHYHTFTPSVISLTPSATSLDHVTTIKTQNDIIQHSQGTPISSINISNNNVPTNRMSVAVGVLTDFVAGWGTGVDVQHDYSIRHEITFNGTDHTTPVVDGQVFSMKLSERVVNFSTGVSAGSTDYNGELNSNATHNDYSPITRYITKPITLQNGIDAKNLYVTLTQLMPSATEIQVFARHLPENSEEQIRNERWTQMWLLDQSGLTGSLDPSSTSNLTYSLTPLDLRDIQYKLPEDVDGGLGEYQIKFVLHADPNNLTHPIVLNMRSIAVL